MNVNETPQKIMLTVTKQIYSDKFNEKLAILGFVFWYKNVETKSVWGSKDWQVQVTKALFRASLISKQIMFLNETVQQTSCLGLATIKDMKIPHIPTPAHIPDNITSQDTVKIETILSNNRSHSEWEKWLIWPIDTNGCHNRFLNRTKGFTIHRPDQRYTQQLHLGIATTYSIGKLCLK